MNTIDKVRSLIVQEFPVKNFRKHQYEIIEECLLYFLNGGKNVILELPTGIGKSVIAYTIAKVLKRIDADNTRDLAEKGVYYEDSFTSHTEGPYALALTKTKVLQNQYVTTFRDVRSLWSSSYYNCAVYPNSIIKYGNHGCNKDLCSKFHSCDYVVKKQEFIHSDFGVLNYHFYLTLSPKSSHYATQSKVRIFDECHDLESTICSFFETRVSFDFTVELLDIVNRLSGTKQLEGVKLPEEMQDHFFQIVNLQAFFTTESLTEEVLFKGLQMINSILSIAIMFTDAIIQSNSHELTKIGNKSGKNFFVQGVSLHKLVSVNRECSFISRNIDEYVSNRNEGSWITYVDSNLQSVLLKPVNSKKYFQSFAKPSYSIFMSATICGVKEFARELGIENYLYITRESPFSKENRKVILVGLPGLNISNKSKNLPSYANRLSSILKAHPNERGIVHTVSYGIADYLYTNVSPDVSSRMVLLKKGDAMDIDSILLSKSNTVVLSPSILEGVDLKDDLARFQVFAKIPYLNLGDQWILVRKNISQEWYARQTIMKIVQGSGRGIRSDLDHCVTYILDGSINNLINRYGYMFPNWFLDSMEAL